MSIYTYLALGDSYTIGEQVPITQSFPYQAVQLLRGKLANSRSIQLSAPEIIAKTGWTTDELLAAIDNYSFSSSYHFVSLLVGVNNQYRGRDVQSFAIEFERLLDLSIAFAGGKSKNVFVLSIPDWGLTPFAEGKDHHKIAAEIDAYNDTCKQLSDGKGCPYIDITASQRMDVHDHAFLAPDLLHPSGKEYAKWSLKLSEVILANLPAQEHSA